jgi:hypothetical protein
MKNVKTFENSSMDTLGFIGTNDELNAIGNFPLIKFWSSEEHYLGISKIGSAISILSLLVILFATTVTFTLNQTVKFIVDSTLLLPTSKSRFFRQLNLTNKNFLIRI